MRYAHLDKENKILGWYSDDIHDIIPTPNIEVTEKVWQEALSISANCYESGKFIVKDFRTDEELKAQELANWKAERAEKAANIEVVHNNVVYQGDEVSQNRMSRAITALPDDITIVKWVANDNSIQNLTRVDLVEVLSLSSIELARIWVEGRPE